MVGEKRAAPEIWQEAALRAAVRPSASAIDVIERSFRWYGQGRTIMPPIMHIDVPPHGNVDVKGAFVEDLPTLTIKIGSGFFSNPKLGLASSGSVMVALNARTGHSEAILLENGYLTDLRTGLAGAVAARHLAPAGPLRLGLVGTGAQARMQLSCLSVENNFQTISVLSRDFETASRFSDKVRQELGLEITPVRDEEELLTQSNILVTTTPATVPVLRGDDIAGGALIIAVGADAPGKRELGPACLESASLIVCDSIAQCAKNGELQYWPDSELAEPGRVTELGKLINAAEPVRTNHHGLIVCDLTGMGIQDTAIAAHALDHVRILDAR